MKWQFDGTGSALGTGVGRRRDGAIDVKAWRGNALNGPYLAVPAGRLRARIRLDVGNSGTVLMEITAAHGKKRLAHARVRLQGQRSIQQEVDLPEAEDGIEVRLFCRGPCRFTILGVDLELQRDHQWTSPAPDRPVGYESAKTYAAKIADGFIDRYLSGASVMEVGFKGYHHATVPIVPQAVGVDLGYPGYDGRRFPFADGSLDAIYSSHCYEHIPDYRTILRDWYRLLRVGGFLVIVVPHQHLFERKRQMPSRWNPDHQRFYTPRSLLSELESALDENSYRVRHLVENDTGFDYQVGPRDAGTGCYEIELVVEKIRLPHWVVDDGAVRPYPAADFDAAEGQARANPYEIALDLGQTGHRVWGPYTTLAHGHYGASFFFDGRPPKPVELVLEVARDARHVATAHVQLSPDRDRHRFDLAFANMEGGGYFEYRVLNRMDQSDAAILFRGVEVRHMATTQPA
jgi:SAM-dependent methyltransferase